MIYRTILIALTIITSSLADKSFTVKFGPYWPDELQESEKPVALDLAIQSGVNIDKKVSFGAMFDFIWNKNSKEYNLGGNLYEEDLIDRTFMFPLSGYITISPLSELIVSPSLTAQIGMAFMYYKDKYVAVISNQFIPYEEDGWYFGPFIKLGLDAFFNISPNAAIFLGPEYTWAELKKIKRDNLFLFTKRDMSGWGLRFGVSAYF